MVYHGTRDSQTSQKEGEESVTRGLVPGMVNTRDRVRNPSSRGPPIIAVDRLVPRFSRS